ENHLRDVPHRSTPFRNPSESAACPETPFEAVAKPCQNTFRSSIETSFRKPSEYDTCPESQPESLLRNVPSRNPLSDPPSEHDTWLRVCRKPPGSSRVHHEAQRAK